MRVYCMYHYIIYRMSIIEHTHGQTRARQLYFETISFCRFGSRYKTKTVLGLVDTRLSAENG